VASVFLSQSSRDWRMTRHLCDRLRAAGFAALFVGTLSPGT